MRADCFHEPQRLLSDVRAEMKAALMCVLKVVLMPLNGELNVATCDDLTAQDGVAVVADAVGMVSGCHAGDVDPAEQEAMGSNGVGSTNSA